MDLFARIVRIKCFRFFVQLKGTVLFCRQYFDLVVLVQERIYHIDACNVACSAGVFFWRGNVLLAKVHVETRKEGTKWGEVQFYSPFLRHNKDDGYNSTNINKQLSPAQNTPALQATCNEH